MFNCVQKSTQNEQKPLMEDVGPGNSQNKTKGKYFKIYTKTKIFCVKF